jgi:hypothetical protein
MNMGNITNYERETIINYNDEEKEASVYTLNKSLIRRLDGLCQKNPDIFKCTKTQSDGSKEYEFPKKYVSIRAPKILSEEQKLKCKERFMKKINSQQN